MIASNDALGNLDSVTEDIAGPEDTFRRDVLEGLSAEPKRIPAKHLYDARGSELFGRICELEEYYLTRAESEILEQFGPDIARLLGRDVVLIEPGAGDAVKTEALAAQLEAPVQIVLADISMELLLQSATRLARRFPETRVTPVHADFTRLHDLPNIASPGRVLFFPGSTIGNLDRGDRERLWRLFDRIVGPAGRVLIGVDLVKNTQTLLRAYDDASGVSAAFNANVLVRINRELGGDFNLSRFRYEPRWNPELSCVEMGQVSLRDQTVAIESRLFHFREGERLQIERSYKFTERSLASDAGSAGFAPIHMWTDAESRFLVALFSRAANTVSAMG